MQAVRKISTSAVLSKGRFPWYNIQKPVNNPKYGEPEYFEQLAAKVPIGPQYIDKLGEIWLERESSVRELTYKREDQLIRHKDFWLPEVDPMTPRLAYQSVAELKSAPESVKKIVSIGYGDREDLTAQWQVIIMDLVRQNRLDETSLEAKIAQQTFLVRQFTKLLHEMTRKPMWLRSAIVTAIETRRKLLHRLREENLESFERLLKELRIAYRIPPLVEEMPLQTRKGWVEHQVKVRCEAVREEKLAECHKRLVAKQPEFLSRKESTLARLAAEEKRIRAELDALLTADGEELQVAGEFRGHSVDLVSEALMHRHYYLPPPPKAQILAYQQQLAIEKEKKAAAAGKKGKSKKK